MPARTLLPALLLLLCGCNSTHLEEYTSTEGKYRVLFPGSPRPDPDVPEGVHKMSLVQQSGEYAVVYEDVGDEDAEDRLDRACDGAVQRLKGTEVSRSSITLAGKYPGREVVIDWPRRRLRARTYLVGNRQYTISAAGAKWWTDSAEADRFLGSFSLLEEGK